MNQHPLFIRSVALRRDDVPSYDDYPFSVPVIRDLRELLESQVTFIVGENGSGKSTLTGSRCTRCRTASRSSGC